MQEYICELEKNLVKGDIIGASRAIAQIYDHQDALDRATRQDLEKLEAIFLSLVRLRIATH